MRLSRKVPAAAAISAIMALGGAAHAQSVYSLYPQPPRQSTTSEVLDSYTRYQELQLRQAEFQAEQARRQGQWTHATPSEAGMQEGCEYTTVRRRIGDQVVTRHFKRCAN